MYLQVDVSGTPSHVRLEEPEDCARFKLVVRGAENPQSLATALDGIGRLADGDRHVDRGWRASPHGGRWVPESWDESFEKMLAYARKKGWMSGDGTEVRAHCEWVSTRVGRTRE